MRISFIRFCNLLLVPIYIFAVLIPIYYFHGRLSCLNGAMSMCCSGILGLKSVGGSGYVISIKIKMVSIILHAEGGCLGTINPALCQGKEKN